MKRRSPIQDTDAEAHRIVIELARKTPIWKKFAQVAATTETCRAFARAGIRRRHPDATEDEIKYRLAALMLGREIVKKVYGWDPEKEGY
jgi:hypothetical protein